MTSAEAISQLAFGYFGLLQLTPTWQGILDPSVAKEECSCIVANREFRTKTLLQQLWLLRLLLCNYGAHKI